MEAPSSFFLFQTSLVEVEVVEVALDVVEAVVRGLVVVPRELVVELRGLVEVLSDPTVVVPSGLVVVLEAIDDARLVVPLTVLVTWLDPDLTKDEEELARGAMPASATEWKKEIPRFSILINFPQKNVMRETDKKNAHLNQYG